MKSSGAIIGTHVSTDALYLFVSSAYAANDFFHFLASIANNTFWQSYKIPGIDENIKAHKTYRVLTFLINVFDMIRDVASRYCFQIKAIDCC